LEEFECSVTVEELIIPLDEKVNGTAKALSIESQPLFGWANKTHEAEHCSTDTRFSRHERKPEDRAHRHPPVANWSIGDLWQLKGFVEYCSPVSDHVVGHEQVIRPQLAEF